MNEPLAVDRVHGAVRDREALDRFGNALWGRWTGKMRVHDGFQVDAFLDNKPEHRQVVFRVTVFGGASFVGGCSDAKVAMREHVRRQRRRRAA